MYCGMLFSCSYGIQKDKDRSTQFQCLETSQTDVEKTPAFDVGLMDAISTLICNLSQHQNTVPA